MTQLNIQYPDLAKVALTGARINYLKSATRKNQTSQHDLALEREKLREDIGAKREERQRKTESHEAELKLSNLDYETKLIEICSAYLDRVENIADYQPMRQFVINKFGVNPEILPDPHSFNGDEAAFDQWRNNATLTAQERIAINKEKLGGRKIGDTRKIQRGSELVTEEFTADGWSEVGRGPKWEPDTDEGGVGRKHKDLQYNRLRNRISKLWGANEFSRLDEATAEKVEKATVRARELYDQGTNMDEAINQANNEVRGSYMMNDIPTANRGLINNKSQTINALSRLSGYVDAEKIETLLSNRGWVDEEISEIMGEAGIQTPLTKEMAKQLLMEAGGDKERARQLARERRYKF